MYSTIRSLNLVLLPALLVAAGCASTSSSPAVEPTEPTPAASVPKAEPRVAELAPTKPTPVYFDTDRAVLRPEAREALKRYATTIIDHPEWGVLTIEGHCDERGSQEYNLGLGKRRAAVVETYLADMGVPASRLETRSFGEERPAVAGHSEEAWRYNRRSEFMIEARSSASR